MKSFSTREPPGAHRAHCSLEFGATTVPLRRMVFLRFAALRSASLAIEGHLAPTLRRSAVILAAALRGACLWAHLVR